MGKRIIVTAGPTNEQIDSVMKITNMSTGSLGAIIADEILNAEETSGGKIQIDKLYYVSSDMAVKPSASLKSWLDPRIDLVRVESTDDLLREMTRILTEDKIDLVIHSAAVGDYKAKYTIRGEDLATEIAHKVLAGTSRFEGVKKAVMEVLDNPQSIQNDDTKISSYEPHLMTMLTLTPKVIGSIKKTSPNTRLVGFKLLDKVSQEELVQVASRLREKNDADFIVANDLSKIGNGKHWALVVGKDGIVQECFTKKEIAKAIISLTL